MADYYPISPQTAEALVMVLKRAGVRGTSEIRLAPEVLIDVLQTDNLQIKLIHFHGHGNDRYALKLQHRDATTMSVEEASTQTNRDALEAVVALVAAETPVLVETRLVSGITELRPIGLAAGDFVVPDGFDDPLPDELLDQFEG